MTTTVATALLATIPGSAEAADPWDLPVAVSVSSPGNGWGSIAVSTDGSPYNVDVSMPYLTKASQIAILPYDASGNYTGGVISTGLNDARTAYRIDVGSIPGVSVHEEEEVTYGALPGGKLYLHVEVNYPPRENPFVGTIRWVFYGVGRDSTAWSWSLEAEPGSGVIYGEPLGGSNAFLALTQDFEQETGAGVVANVTTNSAGARATVNARFERAFSSTFVGAWLNYGTQGCCAFNAVAQDQLVVTSDAGYSDACDGWCFYTDLTGPLAPGPGLYTFTDEIGASAGRYGFEEFILAGADVVLADLPAGTNP